MCGGQGTTLWSPLPSSGEFQGSHLLDCATNALLAEPSLGLNTFKECVYIWCVHVSKCGDMSMCTCGGPGWFGESSSGAHNLNHSGKSVEPELTDRVALASQDALFLSARITGELPWSPGVCVDAEDVTSGPHACTASALHTIPSPWSDSGTLMVKY